MFIHYILVFIHDDSAGWKGLMIALLVVIILNKQIIKTLLF